jgi:radical SAM superfamily enzyme YgiQ (UPF0313 family)
MDKIRIYLGDLTYDTVSLSTDSFPLSIGYVGAYCKKEFGTKVEVELFKYIEELEDAIKKSPPDILGLTNYSWNERIGIELFKRGKKINKNMLAVWGGPNFPIDVPSQKKFMSDNSDVDIYVPIEGEIGFANIVEKVLEIDNTKNIREEILSSSIDGCVVNNEDRKLSFGLPTRRIKELDEIPSPYTTGMFDKFFDGRLSPMIQTNRGCPFQCTYCTDGIDEKQKVNSFSLERVFSEINYIAKHVPKKTNLMFIADLNFGMMPRDKQICDAIAEIQEKYNYPKKIDVSTGKNSRDKIVDAIKSLNGALSIKISVQSTDKNVLENVKRSNISTDQMLAIAPAIKESGLPSQTEIIIGLPGDTYESNVSTLKDMLKVDVDEYLIYTLMLLHGSELNTPIEREKWGFNTKFRILPRSFTQFEGKKIMEIEEVVVSSNSLSFNDYIKLRQLAFSMFIINQISFKPLIKFLRQNKIDLFNLFEIPIESDNLPIEIKKIFEEFSNSTINELWDSPEEIIDNFQKGEEYNKLLNDEAGFNVMQFFYAKVVTKFSNELTEFVIDSIKKLLIENENFSELRKIEFENIANYCRGLTSNPLGLDEKTGMKKYSFQLDVKRWYENDEGIFIDKFRFEDREEMMFCYSKEEEELFENFMNVYGTTPNGMSQVLKRIPKKNLWRHAVSCAQEKEIINFVITRKVSDSNNNSFSRC